MKGNKNFRTFGQIAAHELFAHVRYYLMMRFGVDESIWYHLFINQNDGKGGTVEVDVSPIKNVCTDVETQAVPAAKAGP